MFLKSLFQRAKSNPFFKNAAILASGTVISQLIVIATSPILSRIYLVESFGLLSLFTSYLTISAVISTGRYELAVPLPERDDDARKLIQLITGIGFSFTIFYYLVLILCREVFHLQDRIDILRYWWIYFAPVYIFFIAVNSGLGYWFQRKKEYRKIAIANALQVILTSLLSMLFGLLHIEWGMILSLIISIFCTILFLFRTYHRGNKIFSWFEIRKIAKRYISFPKYMTVSDLSLTVSQQFTPIFFSFLFSTTVVGFYSMANRMIRLPSIVITSAIGNVFRNDAIDEIRVRGNCKALYRSTFKKLVIMSFPIYLLLFFLSPILFTFFFGHNWHTAGIFARILSVLLFFEFIVSPLNSVFYIRGKQKELARLQLSNAIFGAIGIYAGFYFFNSAQVSLVLFVAFAMLFNLIFLFLSHKYSIHD